MRKNIPYLLVLFAMIVLTACGRNTEKDPQEPPPMVIHSYSFFNATTPIIIHKPSEVNGTVIETHYPISVQLLKHGLVEIGLPIQMKPFDFKYGTIEASIVDTDENGMATFAYLPPSDNAYDRIQGQTFIVEAIFLNPHNETNSSTTSSVPDILLRQSFLLQFQ